LRVILKLDFPGCPPEPVLSLPKGGHAVIPAKAGIQPFERWATCLNNQAFSEPELCAVSILLGAFLPSFITDIDDKLRNHCAKRKNDDQPEPYNIIVIHIISSFSKNFLCSTDHVSVC
jgi:hypothetical protein